MDRFNKVSEGFVDMRINFLKEELKEYGEKNKLRGLEGRIERGLDPAGILAVDETRSDAEFIVKKRGGKIEDLEKFTNQMHVGGVWENADKLSDENDPEASTWMILAQVTDHDKETHGDMEQNDFLKDLKRVKINLTQAKINPNKWHYDMKDKCLDSFEERNGIPFSKEDTGFVAMAIAGHKAGIVEDDNGLLFVGSKKLDCSFLENEGYKKETREDRSREVDFYVDKNGEDVAKQLYPGFVIVLNKDRNLAEYIVANGYVENLDKFTAEARRLRVEDMETIQELANDNVDRVVTNNMVWGFKDPYMKNRLINFIEENVMQDEYFGYKEMKKFALPMAKIAKRLEGKLEERPKLKKWVDKTLENHDDENNIDRKISDAIEFDGQVKEIDIEIERITRDLRERKGILESKMKDIASELAKICPTAYCESTDHDYALAGGEEYFIIGLPKELSKKDLKIQSWSRDNELYIDGKKYEGEWDYADSFMELLEVYIEAKKSKK